jgi:auxin efflux carrier family protein
MTWLFRFPNWVTPAVAFNNTTSLPLLLIHALGRTGILSRLIISDSDSSADALKRADSYFLVASVVSNSFTSALTPGLMGGWEVYQDDEDRGGNHAEKDGLPTHEDAGEDPDAGQEDGADETTTLLLDNILRIKQAAQRQVYKRGKKYWHKMSPRTRT